MKNVFLLQDTEREFSAKRGKQNHLLSENDALFSNDTGKLGKRKSECSYQESNLRPSDH